MQPSPREALLAAAAAAAAVATDAAGEGPGVEAGAGTKVQEQQQGGVGPWNDEQLRELVDAELRHWAAMVHLQVNARLHCGTEAASE